PVWPWLAAAALRLLRVGLGVAYAIARRGSHRAARTTPTAAAARTTAAAPTVRARSVARTVVPKSRIVIPRLVGQKQQAIATLEALGLKGMTSTIGSSQAAGTVLGQSPAAGKRLARGGSVHLEVAAGHKQKTKQPAPAPAT